MYHLASFSAIALSLAASVSSLVVPRAAPPQGWDFALLESYDVYHSRYMALSCNTMHNTAFFDQCCHPLLATQSLSSRPTECNPNATTPASSTSSDGDDSDLPDCDDDDDDDVANSTSTSTSPLPTTSKPPPPVPAPTTSKAPVAASSPVTTHPAPVATPTPKKVIASPAPVAAPSTDSAVNTGGFATFFYQNNNFGACGQKHSDSDLIAAIDGARYGNLGAKSSLCGRKVKITNTQNKKSVTVTIEDACPTCDNNNSIDLSVGAFQHIADLSEGIVPIDWQFA